MGNPAHEFQLTGACVPWHRKQQFPKCVSNLRSPATCVPLPPKNHVEHRYCNPGGGTYVHHPLKVPLLDLKRFVVGGLPKKWRTLVNLQKESAPRKQD